MKYGLSIPQFEDFADIRRLASLAQEAEEVGWDGFFIWDHMIFDNLDRRVIDPWVAMAAIAMNTSRVRVGPMITPIARRRPWKLAREALSIDQLSNGRLILGVGLGAPEESEFAAFGEETEAKVRARKMDEGLDIFTGLLSGEPFSYSGEFYNLAEMRFLPKPVQSPHIPIWVGGTWPNKKPLQRAVKFDGYFPDVLQHPVTADDWKGVVEFVESQRGMDSTFDLVQYGVTPGDDPTAAAEQLAPYQEAGVTWWIEGISPFDYGFDWPDPWTAEIVERLEQRIRQGPPKLD
jgi:alkanesulfonate monooxygenase SsuD/methylene tetrahydromethanopterin reductase-like flavin-dependent oxidoreductase (luciferase family)